MCTEREDRENIKSKIVVHCLAGTIKPQGLSLHTGQQQLLSNPAGGSGTMDAARGGTSSERFLFCAAISLLLLVLLRLLLLLLLPLFSLPPSPLNWPRSPTLMTAD